MFHVHPKVNRPLLSLVSGYRNIRYDAELIGTECVTGLKYFFSHSSSSSKRGIEIQGTASTLEMVKSQNRYIVVPLNTQSTLPEH